MTPPSLLHFFLLDGRNGWQTGRADGVTHRGRDGALVLEPVAESTPEGEERRKLRGTWISEPLDSEIQACVWHRAVFDVQVPAGAKVVVSTATSQTPCDLDELDGLWTPAFDIVGEPAASEEALESSQALEAPDAPGSPHQEGLVQSRGGRYLRLRLELNGDGDNTPAVRSVRIHFPRETWLPYLPAVFSDNEARRWFLDRFLSIFHTPWSEIGYQIDTFYRYLDPRTVPPGPFLDYLAGWLGQPLEGTWGPRQNRRLLTATPRLLPYRGTEAALREFVRVYLANLSGLKPRQVRPFPVIREGYEERRELVLSQPGADGLGASRLTSPAEGRIQLDAGTRLGRARIVSTGDPRSDVFAAYAYRFTVIAPAAWIRTADDERLVRRAVEEEKPAPTDYRLCLVAPRLRVGVQSTVGVDTVIGAVPRAALAPPPDPPPAPSAPPSHRLSYDLVLGDASPQRPAPPPEPERRSHDWRTQRRVA